MASPVPTPRTTIEDTRERVIVSVQVAFTVFGALSLTALVAGLLKIAPASTRGMVENLSSGLPFSKTLVGLLGRGVAEHAAVLILAFLVGGWLFWTARGMVAWLANYGFPPFDSDLLHPVGPPGSLDPLWLPPIGFEQGMMPFALGRATARQSAPRALGCSRRVFVG